MPVDAGEAQIAAGLAGDGLAVLEARLAARRPATRHPSGLAVPLDRARDRSCHPEQQLAQGVARESGVAQVLVAVDRVLVAAADALAGEVALLDQLGDELVGGALGDADGVGDLTESGVAVLVDVDDHIAVVGEERPGHINDLFPSRGRLKSH